MPQGYLTIAGNRLAVPRGRNIPQIFDLKTGQLLFHDIFGMHPGDSADHWYALTAGARVFSGRLGRPWTRRGIRSIDVANLRLADNNPCPNGVTGAETLYQVSPNGAAVTGRSARPPFKQLWALGFKPAVTPAGAGSYIKAGGRVFSVRLQGKEVLKDFDVAKAAGGPSRGIRKGFHGVPVSDKLLIEFSRAESSKGDAIICGLQVIAKTKQ